jgi:hypothetical protein
MCRFVFDIPDLWLPCHVSFLLVHLIGLVPWLLAVLRMFCNLSQMIGHPLAIYIRIVDAARSIKDVLCRWVRIFRPLSPLVVFFVILFILISFFTSSLVSYSSLVMPGAAVLVARYASLVALPA